MVYEGNDDGILYADIQVDICKLSDAQHGQDAFMRSNRIKYLLSNAYFLHPLVAFGERPLSGPSLDHFVSVEEPSHERPLVPVPRVGTGSW